MKDKIMALTIILALALTVASLYATTLPQPLTEDEQALQAALDFLEYSPTYAFDGMPETIQVVDTIIMESYPVQYVFIITFDSAHAGYGDRTGQMLAQVITPHKAAIKIVNNQVQVAILDDVWDMINQKEMEVFEPVDPDTPVTTDNILTPDQAVQLTVQYLVQNYEELEGVTIPRSWKKTDLTPQGLVGSSKTKYTAQDWTITITWPVVWKPTYTLEVNHGGLQGYNWKGTIDQNQTITEKI
jgi:hypothetical protein